ncbi:MFS transporter [Burkholderia cepacia]|uniref:MFS transporter n=1 Tax=Burkholderia cepacia TaxID=292 RepID=UPI000753F439|nr:MFS transporter [Burkholderia cepacia]KVU52280.1 MFS transporter [Burkholderia cepacia]
MTVPPPAVERIVGRVMQRLMPFLLLMYVLAFLDRTNVGFAQQAFRQDAGMSDAAFAFGAGVFFVGYALFEIPSNLIMHRVGARVWMCRILVTWGLVSAAMAMASSSTTYCALRFLLGIAEAGFFPGIIYYLTNWFPQSSRARAIGVFYFGVPLAFIVGAPMSGLLLDLHGALGLAGWRWMFIVEGGLASLVGVWAFSYLDDTPADAHWLSVTARRVLADAIDRDVQDALRHGPIGVIVTITNARVLAYAAIYALIQASVYGVIFYLPQQVGTLLGRRVGFEVGLVTAVPWVCALVAAWWVPRRADRSGGHRKWAIRMLVLAGTGIALSGIAPTPLMALAGLCVAASGFIAAQPLFWTIPTRNLTGVGAAGGIALINSLGSVGGFIAPTLRASVDHWFESSIAGLEVLALTCFLAALLIAIVVPRFVGVAADIFNPPVQRMR